MASSSKPTAHPDVHGRCATQVIDAITQRADRLAQGGNRRDGRKLALVLEGGAMRAVQTGGAVVALERLGLTDVFDAIYATSAGAMNAAYLLARQAERGISIYFDHCTTRHFIRPRRPWKMLDIDWLFDTIVRDQAKLDTDTLRASPTDLHVAMIDKSTGQPHLVSIKQTPTDPIDVLKAATAMPVFYNRTVTVDERPCVDGGLLMPFPIQSALRDGATHVLTLLTNPHDHVAKPYTRRARLAFAALFARRHPGTRRLLADYPALDARFRDLAFERCDTPHDAAIATLTPTYKPLLPQLCTDAKTLHTAARHYGQRVLDMFHPTPPALELPKPQTVRGVNAGDKLRP